MKEKSFFLSK